MVFLDVLVNVSCPKFNKTSEAYIQSHYLTMRLNKCNMCIIILCLIFSFNGVYSSVSHNSLHIYYVD